MSVYDKGLGLAGISDVLLRISCIIADYYTLRYRTLQSFFEASRSRVDKVTSTFSTRESFRQPLFTKSLSMY